MNGYLHLPERLGEVKSRPDQLLDALNDAVLTFLHAEYLENASTEVWGRPGRWGGVGLVLRSRSAPRVSCGLGNKLQRRACDTYAAWERREIRPGAITRSSQTWARSSGFKYISH